MPLFDFTCDCGGEPVKDVLLKFSHTKEDYPTCTCGKRMEKLFGKVNSIFKGRGFHCNDYHSPTRGY